MHYEDCDCDYCSGNRMRLREAESNACDSCDDINEALLAYDGKIRMEVWAKPAKADDDGPFLVRMNLGGWKRGDTYVGTGATVQGALRSAIGAAREDGWGV
jgi:hypothetical protein